MNFTEGEAQVVDSNAGVKRLVGFLLERDNARLRRQIISGVIPGGAAIFCMAMGSPDPDTEFFRSFADASNQLLQWTSGLKDLNVDPHLISLWFKRASLIFGAGSALRFYSAWETHRDIRSFKQEFKDWLI